MTLPDLPPTMRAIAISAPGGPENLHPVETPLYYPLDSLPAGEVLIRVIAAGINGPDLAQRRGDYPPRPELLRSSG